MKRKLKFTKYIKDSGTNVYYVLTGATPAESDKFLKFSVKEKKFEKGVGCEFSIDEFNAVGKFSNYEISVNLGK